GRSPVSLASAVPVPERTEGSAVEIVNVQGELSGKAEPALPGLSPDHIYSLSLSVDTPRRVRPQDTLTRTGRGAAREISRKALHLGDPDLYLTFRPTTAGAGKITLEIPGGSATPYPYRLKMLQWKSSPSGEVAVETEPNNYWQEANPIR